jgi:hypothetical protein
MQHVFFRPGNILHHRDGWRLRRYLVDICSDFPSSETMSWSW